MNDLFRAIFGLTPNDEHGKSFRMDERPPEDHRTNFRGHGGDDDDDDYDNNDDDSRMAPRGGIFGFPLFNDPSQIHQHFERLVNEMNKAFGVFGLSWPSVTWEEDSGNIGSFSGAEPKQEEESLRDSFLKKPDCMCNPNSNNNGINISIRTSDFAPGASNSLNLDNQKSYSSSYSVFIRTVCKPDGTCETIKTVRDPSGNEKIIITQSNPNEPLPPSSPPDGQLLPKDDKDITSIFRKFFPF